MRDPAIYSESEEKEHTLLSENKKNIRSGAKLPSGASKSKILLLFLFTLVEITLYTFSLSIESDLLYVSLYVICALLFVMTFALSGAGTKRIPTKNELRSDWSDKQKDAYIGFLTKGRRISKVLMLALLPLVFILGYDILKLVFF